MITSLLAILEFFCLIKAVVRTRVHFGHKEDNNVHKNIIERLSENEDVISEHKAEDCDVCVMFCTIVSRVGTDIEAFLRHRPRADKPTLVFVLHQTFNPEHTVPDSSMYDNNKLKLLDILFYENQVLPNCSKNTDAINQAQNYLKKCGKRQRKINIKQIRNVSVALLVIFAVYTWSRYPWDLPMDLHKGGILT